MEQRSRFEELQFWFHIEDTSLSFLHFRLLFFHIFWFSIFQFVEFFELDVKLVFKEVTSKYWRKCTLYQTVFGLLAMLYMILLFAARLQLENMIKHGHFPIVKSEQLFDCMQLSLFRFISANHLCWISLCLCLSLFSQIWAHLLRAILQAFGITFSLTNGI